MCGTEGPKRDYFWFFGGFFLVGFNFFLIFFCLFFYLSFLIGWLLGAFCLVGFHFVLIEGDREALESLAHIKFCKITKLPELPAGIETEL